MEGGTGGSPVCRAFAATPDRRAACPTDFCNCVSGAEEPLETGEDGRAVLEIFLAAYEGARTGRKVQLPPALPAGIPAPTAVST